MVRQVLEYFDSYTPEQIIRRKTGRKFFVIFMLATSIVLCGLFLPTFNIAEIDVSGNNSVDKQNIIALSGIKIGTNIFRINLSQAQKILQKQGFVERVAIKRKLPSKIAIELKERVAAGYMLFMGTIIRIDKNGIMIGTVKEEQQHIPIIEGLHIKKYQEGEKIQVDNEDKFEVAIDCIRQIVSAGLSDKIQAVNVDDINSIRLKTFNNVQVLFGDKLNIKYKTNMLKEILAELHDPTQGIIDISTDKATYRSN